MSDTLTALEAALRESPDDPVLLDAITDYFLDHDDPRGEYIRAVRAGDEETRKRTSLAALATCGALVMPTGWHYCWLAGGDVLHLTTEILDALGRHPLFKQLGVHPSDPADAADDEVRLLIASGLIDRLETLTFHDAGVTDDGALALASCPAVAKLRDLKLHRCLLSPIGMDALARVGHRDVGEQNLTPWWGQRDVIV